MLNSDPLPWFGGALILIVGVLIVVPYLRGKSDILTAWNLLLLGGAMFMGVGSLAVKYGFFHWPELQWFQPTQSDVQKYLVGSIVFFSTLFVTYYLFGWPTRLSAGLLNKWPPMSLPLVIGALLFFGFVVVGATVSRGVFFIGPALRNMSHKALVFSVVFSFCYWYQNKRQLPMLVLFCFVFLLAALDAMVVFRGRRLLLSVAVAPLICMYWMSWRYLPPRKNLLRLGIVAVIAIAVVGFYGTFRHFRDESEGRTFATTIAAMRTTSAQKVMQQLTENAFFKFSQYCAHYSLLTIHLLDNGQIESEPLHSMAFVATYPIPRVAFPDKPQMLSGRMPRDILRLLYKTNWGLGIVGTGYHEGGLPVIALYAVLIVLVVRLLDGALLRQPDNVFLLGILCTIAPHIAALIRGDFAVMLVEILEALAFAWLLGLVARFLFGTAPRRALSPAAAAYPQLGGRVRHVGT